MKLFQAGSVLIHDELQATNWTRSKLLQDKLSTMVTLPVVEPGVYVVWTRMIKFYHLQVPGPT